MALDDFLPPRPSATPTIYAFASTHPDHAGLLKVGYTERSAMDLNVSPLDEVVAADDEEFSPR